MKELTALLALLLLLTSCGESYEAADNSGVISAGISAEESNEDGEISNEVTTITMETGSGMTSTTTQTTAVTQPTVSGTQETLIVNEKIEMAKEKEPVDPEKAAVQDAETVSPPTADNADKTEKPVQQMQDSVRQTEKTVQATECEPLQPSVTEETVRQTEKTVQTTECEPFRTTLPEKTVRETDSEVLETQSEADTEPKTEEFSVAPDGRSDYEKAEAVYEYMQQNGYGTCVNYACQTYEQCREIGLECYLVWTDAGMYGHVANIVNVDGVWYVLDTEGGFFLDYNYGFTEVVDTDGQHIADSGIISKYSYAELHYN